MIEVVKKGTFLYAETVFCDIRIVLKPVRYGTGDYEDAPEIANDVDLPGYYIAFGSVTQRGLYPAGKGWYATPEEAMQALQHDASLSGTLQWKT